MMVVPNRRTSFFVCFDLKPITGVICIVLFLHAANSAKLFNKHYPAGADLFEHEFPNIGLGVYLKLQWNFLGEKKLKKHKKIIPVQKCDKKNNTAA